MDERHSGYVPLFGGWNLTNVSITGRNATIEGCGDKWWPIRANLAHGRPHLFFCSRCTNVSISNLTFVQSPFWTIRFWASQSCRVQDVTILATCASENNDGVDADSSADVHIENLYYDGW